MGLAILLGLHGTAAAGSAREVTSYDIAIASIAAGWATAQLSCRDDGTRCETERGVDTGDTPQRLRIAALVIPGNAYFRFRLSGRDLFVNRAIDRESFLLMLLAGNGTQ